MNKTENTPSQTLMQLLQQFLNQHQILRYFNWVKTQRAGFEMRKTTQKKPLIFRTYLCVKLCTYQ
jgi:hypothetical protein